MDEIKKPEVDPTQEGQDLPKEAESNSTTPQTITMEEHNRLLGKGKEDAISQYGDRIQREKIEPIATELSTFKSKVTQLETDAEEAATSKDESENRITELESDLETATDGNPDLDEIRKIKVALRDERKKARQDASDGRKANAELKRTLEADREKYAGVVTEALAAKFEVDVFEVAEEYVDAAGQPIKSERLKALCEKAGQTKKGDIQELADTLWVKKDKAPAMVSDSGVTSGSKGGLTLKQIEAMSPEERFARADEIAKMPMGYTSLANK